MAQHVRSGGLWTTLSISGDRINDADLAALLTRVNAKASLRELKLRCKNLTGTGLAPLTRGIYNSRGDRSALLSCSRVFRRGVSAEILASTYAQLRQRPAPLPDSSARGGDVYIRPAWMESNSTAR